MKPSEVLKTYGWCQGTYARTASYINCMANDERATHFCLIGSVQRAYWASDNILRVSRLLDKITGECYATQFNDQPTRTKEQVIALLESIGE